MEYIEVTGKTLEEAKEQAAKELNAASAEDVVYEVVEEGSSGILGLGGKEAKVRAALKKDAFLGNLDKFLRELFIHMGIAVKQKISQEADGNIKVNLDGDDLAVIIGRNGSTLDAIQLVTNIAANKGTGEKIKVLVDAKGYKEKKERALKDLALTEAEKVKKEKRSKILNPMPPNERRIIHLALQEHPFVKTYSSGEEPMRKVIISLKEDE